MKGMITMDEKEQSIRKIIEALREAGDNRAELAVLCFGLGLNAADRPEQPPKSA